MTPMLREEPIVKSVKYTSRLREKKKYYEDTDVGALSSRTYGDTHVERGAFFLISSEEHQLQQQPEDTQ